MTLQLLTKSPLSLMMDDVTAHRPNELLRIST